MTIADDAHNRRTVVTLGAMLSDLFTMCAQEAHRSVQEGSEITGAPGQPVDTGALRSSVQLVFESKDRAVIGTNLDYALSIEDGLSYAHGGTPMTLRSEVGGFHSFKLTEAGMPKIVTTVAAQVKREHGERE
jgi:hypothetical protein